MMRAFSLEQARQWTGGTLRAGDGQLTFSGVSTDSRRLAAGDLFVAIRGEHFDGHDFLQQVRAAGAVAAVVETADPSVDLPQLVVPDTIEALARLAAGNRAQSRVKLVAVTGSSGKTTVRELTAAILAQMGPTLATHGNLNNHIGVPLTLFRLAPEHRFAALELGASGPGEIAHLVSLCQPRVVILTNASPAHLEGFGSYENIVRAKGEIIDGVAADGLVVLNRDDPAFGQWQARAGDRRVTAVSLRGDSRADYVVAGAEVSESGQRLLVAGAGGWSCELRLPLLGEHNRLNLLLAIAAARELGATDEQIVAGAESVRPVPGRLYPLRLCDGLTLIDDTYNANPASMKAALSVLAGFAGHRVAIFGAMAELGESARRWHREVGALAKAAGVNRLVLVGPGSDGYAEGFGPGAEHYPDHESATDAVWSQLQKHTTLLVKGSRSAAMERVVEGLKEKVNDACCSG